eukprot:25859-Prorocentrum_lima.AAC.1
MNKHGEDVSSLWHLYARLATQAIISGYAAEVPTAIELEFADPFVIYSSLIVNAEIEELKNA